MKLTKKQIKAVVKEVVLKRLNEAVEDSPKADYAKYGTKVDDFINDTVKKASDLHDEGENLLFGDDNAGSELGKGDDKYLYVSSRMALLKNVMMKLSQRYESLRRERQ